eukprot:CAMPEP_0172357440 /NCGR_PEP_ID=MMETSP1060-20121228/1808_1 /TAXON_ID=37318 /ORGANISM="Pseudo-nitzschia pungens, Strain cf. cingulata" /LENGTH=363 /DNA_ID=CAMNT_0013078131 /DNA_START=222 /DNA_END=1313 /DNA_ORIENTATION=-
MPEIYCTKKRRGTASLYGRTTRIAPREYYRGLGEKEMVFAGVAGSYYIGEEEATKKPKPKRPGTCTTETQSETKSKTNTDREKEPNRLTSSSSNSNDSVCETAVDAATNASIKDGGNGASSLPLHVSPLTAPVISPHPHGGGDLLQPQQQPQIHKPMSKSKRKRIVVELEAHNRNGTCPVYNAVFSSRQQTHRRARRSCFLRCLERQDLHWEEEEVPLDKTGKKVGVQETKSKPSAVGTPDPCARKPIPRSPERSSNSSSPPSTAISTTAPTEDRAPVVVANNAAATPDEIHAARASSVASTQTLFRSRKRQRRTPSTLSLSLSSPRSIPTPSSHFQHHHHNNNTNSKQRLAGSIASDTSVWQ